MRRLAIVLALVAAAVFTASTSTALAAPPTIEDFVKDCDPDPGQPFGEVHVSGTARYRGGSAVLNGLCRVIPEPGSTFVLRDVELTGSGGVVVTTGPISGADVTVKVIDSEIVLGSFVELNAGAAAGDPGVPEQNGRVVIRNSTVSGSAVLVWASFDWPDGRIVIRNSSVVATSGDLSLRASDLGGIRGVVRVTGSTLLAPTGDITVRTGTQFPSGDDGRVRIVDATLDAGGSTSIDSGPNGRTVVRTSAIPGTPVTITTGPGGFCRTVGLTPPIACS